MIPVPASELELYDYENEEDLTYKAYSLSMKVSADTKN